MSRKQQLFTLVSTFRDDSHRSGLPESISMSTLPTRQKLPECRRVSSSASSSQQSSSSSSSLSFTSNSNEARNEASSSCSPMRRKLRFIHNWKGGGSGRSCSRSTASSSEPTKSTKPPKNNKQHQTLRHFRLRPSFHRFSSRTNDECELESDSDATAPVSASSSSTTTTESTASSTQELQRAVGNDNGNDSTNTAFTTTTTNNNNNNNTLFRDQMDIVAYQEWPLQRRQRQQLYQYNYTYNNRHYYSPVMAKSPSSVCPGNNNNNNNFSIETIATKLGRSPVVVSFDDIDLIHPPTPIRERIQTGRFRGSQQPKQEQENGDESDSMSQCNKNYSVKPTNAPRGIIESFLVAMESTLFHMRCSADR